MNRFPCPSAAARRQRQAGMVLLLCLMLLCSLTLVGLSATADSVLQGQLAANWQDSERARQTALTALSWAETWLLGQGGGAPEVCNASCEGLTLHAAGSLPAHPERESADWWAANGHEAGFDPLSGDALTPITTAGGAPVYWLLEWVHEEANDDSATTLTWYHILVRATGRRDTSVSVIEGLFERSWPQTVGTADGTANTDPTEKNLPGCNTLSGINACGRIAWRVLRR